MRSVLHLEDLQRGIRTDENLTYILDLIENSNKRVGKRRNGKYNNRDYKRFKGFEKKVKRISAVRKTVMIDKVV